MRQADRLASRAALTRQAAALDAGDMIEPKPIALKEGVGYVLGIPGPAAGTAQHREAGGHGSGLLIGQADQCQDIRADRRPADGVAILHPIIKKGVTIRAPLG